MLGAGTMKTTGATQAYEGSPPPCWCCLCDRDQQCLAGSCCGWVLCGVRHPQARPQVVLPLGPRPAAPQVHRSQSGFCQAGQLQCWLCLACLFVVCCV